MLHVIIIFYLLLFIVFYFIPHAIDYFSALKGVKKNWFYIHFNKNV